MTNTSIADKLASMDYGQAPEDSKPAFAWLEGHGNRFRHFIGGAWAAGSEPAGELITRNPATGSPLAAVSRGTEADVDRAVLAARAALPDWQALTPHARARFLYALARQLQKHARRFAVLETLDNGKPIRESRDIDIPLAIRHFYHHAGWAQLVDSEFPGYRAVGVVGQVIPWNFPLLMLAWKIAPALAAGNTVVLKPAETTPLTALAFAELCQAVGLPPGVVNIVTGDGVAGAALARHPDVDKVAFTGSTEVGRAIRAATAASRKKLTLELGGKSPFVVFDDADLDSAVEGLVDGIFLNQGQVCCAGSRLLLQERIADKFVAKLTRRMATLRVGSPLDKSTDIGAINSAEQLARITHLVNAGLGEGATMASVPCVLPATGFYFPPTLLTNVHPASTLAREEIFGPVLVAMTFRTPAEAAELANNTAYGLAASVWSENINVALQAAAQIKAGVVWVNSTNVFDAACGFGGMRESGFGREGGREGLREYLEPTWVQDAPLLPTRAAVASDVEEAMFYEPAVDRTVKLYIGGKQVRPDSGYSTVVTSPTGEVLGEVPLGNRKDIRNAVEAAIAARGGWAKSTAHHRAQILYYIAENLSLHGQTLTDRLAAVVGREQAVREVETAIERAFCYAAWADKFDGAVHAPPLKAVSIAMNEPLGVVGVVAPEEAPLLGLLSLVLPLIATGNTVVAVPSPAYPLIVGDLYALLDTSDVPGGVVNFVTGDDAELLKVLADHDGVDGLWVMACEALCSEAKARSTGNLKQVFTHDGRAVDWFDPRQGEGRYYLEHATQVKNVWVPYGE